MLVRVNGVLLGMVECWKWSVDRDSRVLVRVNGVLTSVIGVLVC